MRPRTLLAAVVLALAVALAGCHEAMPGDGGPAPGDGGPGESPMEPSPQEPPDEPAPTPPPPPPPEPEPGEIGRTLAAGQQSGHREATHVVLANEEEWQTFWDTHVAFQEPKPERPPVDFTRERVAAVVLGERPNGCYYVQITNVTEDEADDRWVLEITEYVPPPDTVCTDIITYPFHFITIELEPESVAYTQETVEGPPGS